MFLAITSVGWGFNWPVTKYLLSDAAAADPARHHRGDRRAAAGAAGHAARPEPCGCRAHYWPRLVLAAFLNVACWMVLMGLALLWLPASEAALIAYTMPVWASLLAWPILGERPNLLRVLSLVMAFAGHRGHHGRQWRCGQPVETAGNRHGAGRRDRFCGRHRAGQEAAAAICRR